MWLCYIFYALESPNCPLSSVHHRNELYHLLSTDSKILESLRINFTLLSFMLHSNPSGNTVTQSKNYISNYKNYISLSLLSVLLHNFSLRHHHPSPPLEWKLYIAFIVTIKLLLYIITINKTAASIILSPASFFFTALNLCSYITYY